MMKRFGRLGLLAACAVLAHTPAQAGGYPCGSPFVPTPVLKPVLPSASFPQSDAAVNCFMWQTFVYLTWPASGTQPGQPDPQATYGANAATVWETFRPHDTVFLPNGATPAPWGNAPLGRTRTKMAGPLVRTLNNTSKQFRLLNTGEATPLSETQQAGGGALYDQNGQVVYYEMLLNQTEFNYIVNNQLYQAQTQNQFAQKVGIELPTNAIEVKAAWKVLSAQEASAKPLRFHTAQAMVPGSNTPVTVGLVGLHVMVMPDNNTFEQGFWATFQQLDNAPLQSAPGKGPYSFYNANCTSNCTVNSKTATGVPTQVMQVFGASPEAQAVNAAMVQQMQSQTPNAPWQFYQLLNVQWPNSGQAINKPGMTTPLPNGSPNTNTLMNPVLETFLQTPNTSCLGCHTYASATGPGSYGSGYSFLFGHAKTAPQGLLKGAALSKRPSGLSVSK